MQTPNRSGSILGPVEPGILDRQGSSPDGELDGPAHHLEVLAMLAQVGRHVEPLHLAGDLDRLAGGVEALDQTDTGASLDDRLAESPTADAVRRDDPDAGHDDATHTIPHR